MLPRERAAAEKADTLSHSERGRHPEQDYGVSPRESTQTESKKREVASTPSCQSVTVVLQVLEPFVLSNGSRRMAGAQGRKHPSCAKLDGRSRPLKAVKFVAATLDKVEHATNCVSKLPHLPGLIWMFQNSMHNNSDS